MSEKDILRVISYAHADAILEALDGDAPVRFKQIKERTGLKSNGVSRRLKDLLEAGLAEKRRRRYSGYSLTDRGVEALEVVREFKTLDNNSD